MSVIKEIEKKYRILDAQRIEAFLKTMTRLSSGRILDEYYDTLNGDYYQQGIFIRTRNNKTLDIKFNPDHLKGGTRTDHVVCSEYSFNIPFQASSEATFQSLSGITGIKKPVPYSNESFLIDNALCSLVTIDKVRTTYENESCIIALDELCGFGSFIEFEAKDSTQNPEDFVRYLEDLTKGLPLEPISSGYVEFALRQTNESLYRKGKYLLEGTPRVAA